MEGELTFWIQDQESCVPLEVQLAQIPQLGGSSAYPDHPRWLCKFEKVVPVGGGGVFGVPVLPTVRVSSALDDQPQLSHSVTAMLYVPAFKLRFVSNFELCTLYASLYGAV
jgi:hypothetical protein